MVGTFLVTYITWGSIAIANHIGYLSYGTPMWMILYIIGVVAPPIMSYIVLKKNHSISGIKEFIKIAFNLKAKPVHYAVLLCFLAVYFEVSAVMQGISSGAKLYVAFLSIPIMILVGGLEELGWRYILQPELEKNLPFGIAASFTACTWSVWHLPLFFMYGTVQSNMHFGLFAIMVFGMSFALATIYYVSKNIWLCILFHSMINALASSWIIKDSVIIKICTTLSIIILSFIIVHYYKKNK